MSRAVRPEDIGRHIPDEVIEVVNDMIRERFDGKSATLEQSKLVDLIVERVAVSRQQVFDRGWLNFEREFEAAGWIVEYDKPGYCETYPATFTFRVAS